MIPLLTGAVLAVIMAAAGRLTRFDEDKSFYPTILIVIASYYVLFAFMADEAIVEEIIYASLFTGLAIAAAFFRPVLVGIGILAHGLFDFAHPMLVTNSGVPEWWPGFCAGVDVVLGFWVIYWLGRRQQSA